MAATFPDMCKIANVIPLHKGGNPVDANYRPISLLPFLSKILEIVVDMQVRKHLETNNKDLGRKILQKLSWVN